MNGQAEELMELAVDAAQSRHLPGFLERFAERAARIMLRASASEPHLSNFTFRTRVGGRR